MWRWIAIWLAVAIGVALAGWRYGSGSLAQTSPIVRSEQWPMLGIDPHEIVFDNGFRIVLVEDHRVPRVAASLQYRFGALSERNGEHGSAHFLEHAMHQGTTSVGVKDRDIDRRLLKVIHDTEQELLAERNAHRNAVRERNVFYDEGEWPATEKEQALRRKLYELEDEQSKNRTFWEEYNWYRRHGGLMRHGDPVPANTGNELLRIEVDLPRERMEMFFRLEADRMVNAVLRGWEAQRFTVLEQFFVLQRNDVGRFQEALNGVTGIAHPIYIHTGGHERDHAYWNRASMLRLYDDYIVPNNATLTLIGDITVDDARRLGTTYFGRVPRAPSPPANMDVETEPPPGGSVRLDWLEPIEPTVLVRYRIPGVGHPDRPAFDVVARLLRGSDGLLASSPGGSSRGGDWQASASSTGSQNTLTVQSRAGRDEDLAGLERAALEAIERFRRDLVDEARLVRVRREFQLDLELLRADRGGLATQFGSFAIADDWRTLRTQYEARHTTTAEDVRRVAQRYLVPWNRVIATTRSNPQPRAEANTDRARSVTTPRAGESNAVPRQADRETDILPGRTRPLLEHDWAHPRDLTFAENRFTPPDPNAALIVTSSGVRAYVIPDATQRVVQLTAAVPFGRSTERINEAGAAELLSRLLSQQITDRLGASFLGRVQVDQDMDLTRFTLQVLQEDWQVALSALVATLREPYLDPAAIDAYRTGAGFLRQTRGIGGTAFRPAVELSRLIAAYPIAPPDPGLPVHREAVRQVASRALRPGALAIGVAGGITREQVARELQASTKGWQNAEGPSHVSPIPTTGNSTTRGFRSIEEPGYTTWIAVGHTMPPIDPVDEAAVAVMTDLLNIRLTIAVREIRGLANATQLVMPATTRHGGLLHVRSGARPESIAPIIRFSRNELARLRERAGAPSPEELEQVKGGIVLGKWQALLDTALDASATYAAETARVGSLEHLLKWPDAVRAVTAQAVSAVAQKYIHPETMGTVIIGQVEEVRTARHPRWPVALDEVTGGGAGTRR